MQVEVNATLGILGGGQLGRMLAWKALRHGCQVHVWSEHTDAPACQIASNTTIASLADHDQLRAFARAVDFVTFETENISLAALDVIESVTPVCPGPYALSITQHRIREKQFLRGAGIPTAAYHPIRSIDDLSQAKSQLNGVCVLKSAENGYDGKGQVVVNASSDLESAWNSLGCKEAVLEQFVDLALEFSVIAVRDVNGRIACYDPIKNQHRNHILAVSSSPAGLSRPQVDAAMEIARAVMEGLGVRGVLCAEFFLTQTGEILVNELAPRPHNSGHLTIDTHETCQFEQQLRAVCGLPVGSTRQLRPAAMANLLGDLWADGEPDWAVLKDFPCFNLYLYGKSEVRSGRKMGHLTATADTVALALSSLQSAHRFLADSRSVNELVGQASY